MAKILMQMSSVYSFFKEFLWKLCSVFTDTRSDKTFPKHISRFPNFSNPPCVCIHWECVFSQLKLTKIYNYVAREIGGSRHVSTAPEISSQEDIPLSVSLPKKTHEGKVLRSMLDFFVYMNVATGVTCANNILMKLLST